MMRRIPLGGYVTKSLDLSSVINKAVPTKKDRIVFLREVLSTKISRPMEGAGLIDTGRASK